MKSCGRPPLNGGMTFARNIEEEEEEKTSQETSIDTCLSTSGL